MRSNLLNRWRERERERERTPGRENSMCKASVARKNTVKRRALEVAQVAGAEGAVERESRF